jgi:hypothetical protein
MHRGGAGGGPSLKIVLIFVYLGVRTKFGIADIAAPRY